MTDVRAEFRGEKPADPTKPSIIHNGRQLDDVLAEAIDALDRANTPPRLFVRAGSLVRLRADESGRPVIDLMRNEHVRIHLAEAATWWRVNQDGDHTATSPPLDVATSVLASGSWPMPALAGVVELPVLRPDGSFHTDHGYDVDTRLYHWHAPGTAYQRVYNAPSIEQLAAAVELVDEALCDFPWDTTADRANAWGLLLTPLIRPLVGQVPMALVDAPEPGTGKGLLVEIINLVATGRPGALMAWPSTEEEMDKVITATLMAGQTSIIFDNVENQIRSAKLAAALTADTWSGRILGRSEMVQVPNRGTWVATGNNVEVGGDLARRCYRIRLDARQASPWKRTGFRHPELKEWTLDNRGRILHALCVIVRSWWVAGRPMAASLPAMGSYSGWVRTVGGILEHAGITGFLDNLADFHASADREAQQWEAFLSSWADAYSDGRRTVAELIQAMAGDSMAETELREALPEDLAGYWGTNGFSRRFGQQLRRRTGRHYGPDGIHLVEQPRDRRNVAVYSVTTRNGNPTVATDPTDPPPPAARQEYADDELF